MASELKPCPFCGGKAKLKGGRLSQESYTVWCENLHRGGGFSSAEAATREWNNRPAPAATDTGLVTAVADLEEIQQAVFGSLGSEPDVYADYDRLCELSRKMREAMRVCSQAEELLAVKDESVRDAKQSRDDWKKLAKDLQADNAAQAARVKELEQINAVLMGDDENAPRYTTKRLKQEVERVTQVMRGEASDRQAHVEALVAKLAAAEKALEPFALRAERYNDIPGLIRTDDSVELWQLSRNKGLEVDITVGDLRQARAVLGGKPS